MKQPSVLHQPAKSLPVQVWLKTNHIQFSKVFFLTCSTLHYLIFANEERYCAIYGRIVFVFTQFLFDLFVGVCLGPRLSLILRGPNLPDVEDIEVDLSDSNWTIFRAIQTIIQVEWIYFFKTQKFYD